MNIRNMGLAIKTAREKLDYLEGEIQKFKEASQMEKEGKEDCASAIKYLKARASKEKAIRNDDAMLIIEIQSQFKGRWGKNVLKDVFADIAKHDEKFFLDKRDKQVYLVAIR